jgi:hypothetical protein
MCENWEKPCHVGRPAKATAHKRAFEVAPARATNATSNVEHAGGLGDIGKGEDIVNHVNLSLLPVLSNAAFGVIVAVVHVLTPHVLP